MTARPWSSKRLGDLSGRFVIVTGGNSGIGMEAAREFARHGATVLLACRDVARGEQAKAQLEKSIGSTAGVVQVASLDVSDLTSVKAFVGELSWDRLDILVNNAGVMGGGPVQSAQGFDRQVATNHLGPFALTAGLWPLLEKADAGRVVNVSSLAARGGSLTGSFDASALTTFAPYREMDVYAITKQANLLFTAAHPGLARTNLFKRQLREQGRGYLIPVAAPVYGLAFQSAAAGALPTIRAATDRAVPNGGFVGPKLFGGTRGAPVVIPIYPSGDQPEAAAALWRASEQLTGVPFVIS
jgi:NAD(P)-dependent dehydrogenase (short-subunit alcohol dehydrogenase family)